MNKLAATVLAPASPTVAYLDARLAGGTAGRGLCDRRVASA